MVDKNEAKPGVAGTADQKTRLTKAQIAKAVDGEKNKAEAYVRDPEKAKKLLEDAVNKAKGFQEDRGPFGEVWSYLTALFRLLKAYIGGAYREIPWGSIVLATVGIIYFVCPVDLIPDWLPGGYLDDAAVIAFVVAQIKADLDNFLAWEIAQVEA